MSSEPTGIGAIIIGDEITLGRRQDKHFARIVELLAARGLTLDWALYTGDDRARLTETLRRTFAGGDIVFSCGGIGNTPDDHTRQAAAAAAGVELVLDVDAEREIRGRYAEIGREVSDYALDMGRFPAGSRIIPNPFNRIPGFSWGDHHFVPGFPQMAWPMMDWVLDTLYPGIRDQAPQTEAVITVLDAMESPLLDLMNEFVRLYPDLRFSSLPHIGEGGERKVEFGLRGAPPRVAQGATFLKQEIDKLGFKSEQTAD